MATAPVCAPQLAPHLLEARRSSPIGQRTSQTFAALAEHFLSQSASQSTAALQIAPLNPAPQLAPVAPTALRWQPRQQGSSASASVPSTAQPPQHEAPHTHQSQPASSQQHSFDADGPMPGLSAFAQAAEAPAAAQDAQPARLAEPEPERLRGELPELPELPSALFSASGNLKPLISAFAAAAGETAFDAPPGAVPAAAGLAQSAPAALTAHNMEHRLPSIPQRHTCPCNTQVSLNPIIWRDFEPPFRIMVHVGLKTSVEEGEVSLSLGIYSSLNPRVITTGVPSRRFSPYQRRTASVGITTRAARQAAEEVPGSSGGGLKLRKSGSYPVVPSDPLPARRDKDSFQIMEVVLIKRDPETHSVRDVWHSDRSDTEGNTLTNTPAWPGEWGLDVVCRVSDGLDSSIWLKATGRAVAASPEACLLSSSGRSRSWL